MRATAGAAISGPMSFSTKRRMRDFNAPAAAFKPIAPPIDVPSQPHCAMPSWSSSASASCS